MNQITISGNLTRDPERFATHNGETVAKFTVAVNEGDSTLFLNCVAFKKLADNCLQYIGKGSKVLVSGRLTIDEYETDNKKLSRPEVIAYSVEFLNRREEVESDKDLPFPVLPPREQEKKGIAGALGKKQEAEVDPNDDLPF
jgi:single-strand DNA-binding protein